MIQLLNQGDCFNLRDTLQIEMERFCQETRSYLNDRLPFPFQLTNTSSNHEPAAPMPRELRFWTYTSCLSFFTAGLLGALAHVPQRSLQYTVEHAHAKPRNKQGWYLYHRRKHHTVILQLTRQFLRDGWRLGRWTALFFAVDVGLDLYRHQVDWWHGMVAGSAVGLGFATTAGLGWRCVGMGAATGLGYTGLQCMEQWMRGGQMLAYDVKYLHEDQQLGEKEEEEVEEKRRGKNDFLLGEELRAD